MNRTFDVIIVGGGHSGVEAAYAASKMGRRTLLISLSQEKLGLMPCNPSVGGLGKGHIVYEISALGGLMPKICSATYLQARMLNTSKGPAVQGLRLQVDKYAYNKAVVKTLKETPHLTLHEGMVTQVHMEVAGDLKRVTGLTTQAGVTFYAPSIVITTGTFLNGRIHVGLHNFSSGRRDEAAAVGLTDSLEKLMGVTFGRLKTGTPPRILTESIDFSQLEYQPCDTLDYLFEFKEISAVEKMPVYIAHTNEKTHAIIAANLHRSAMYSGNIKGVGPRYCPSIEDKIGRYPDRFSHHVFVEPEGEGIDEIYPAGLSTSLPLEVQHDYMRSIKGFENAVITKPGYAVEYDFIQPSHLKHSLEAKSVEGLFFAGQVNGTTGYEEAAGQGIIAGINAALKAYGKPPLVLSRNESYLGVMIDDLITLGVDEPYRMFTSRAERRLILRQDNVFARIMPYGRSLGLIDDETYEAFLREQEVVAAGIELVQKGRPHSELFKLFHAIEFTSELKEEAKKTLHRLFEKTPLAGSHLSSRALLSIFAHVKYDGYIERELREVAKAERYQWLELPDDFEYANLSGLSFELQQKLSKIRPRTIAQAELIPGMTPAAISLLIFQINLKKSSKYPIL